MPKGNETKDFMREENRGQRLHISRSKKEKAFT